MGIVEVDEEEEEDEERGEGIGATKVGLSIEDYKGNWYNVEKPNYHRKKQRTQNRNEREIGGEHDETIEWISYILNHV